MPRATTAARSADARRPTWLTDAVGDAWGTADWARWEQRVLPALEAHGVTADMLQPLYGDGDGELLGIGVQAEVGWRVGWLGHPRHRRAAVHAGRERSRPQPRCTQRDRDPNDARDPALRRLVSESLTLRRVWPAAAGADEVARSRAVSYGSQCEEAGTDKRHSRVRRRSSP